MSIILYLMNKKGLDVLEAIVSKFGSQLVSGVFIGSDKNVIHDYSQEIKQICVNENIAILNKSSKTDFFSGIRLAIGWRWIIHEAENLIVLHDSLLPKYRGFSPLPNMLINNEKYIGVTAHYAAKEYDTGDIIYQSKIKVNYPIKIVDAIDAIASLYSKLVLKIIADYIDSKPFPRITQINSDATYSIWRDEEDYFIDFSKSAEYICRFIDAVGYPYLGARSLIGDQILLIEQAEVYPINVEINSPGKVISIEDGMPIVLCRENAIKILNAKYLAGQNFLPVQQLKIKFRNKV